MCIIVIVKNSCELNFINYKVILAGYYILYSHIGIADFLFGVSCLGVSLNLLFTRTTFTI